MEIFDLYKQMDPLIEHAATDEVRKPKLVAGSYLPELQAAKTALAEHWQETYGMEVPEAACRQDYTLTRDERDAIKEAATALVLITYGNYDGHRYQIPHMINKLRDVAPLHRRRIYNEVLDYKEAVPDLTIDAPLTAVPPFQNTTNMREGPAASSVDCMVTVFGMNAVTASGSDPSYYQPYSSSAVRRAIEIHPHAPPTARFDLKWLIGSLTTSYAEEALGAKVRYVMTAGADLGEIDDRIIAPLTSKNPDLRCTVSAVLASETKAAANHAVVITAADESGLTVNDPRFAEPRHLEPQEFWDRWTPANMQAAITIIQPTR